MHFCASGSFQRVVAEILNISTPAACRIIKRVSRSFASLRPRYVCFPTDLIQEKEKFSQFAGFPGVIGALDCTHIRIQCPNSDVGQLYFNRKGFYSINCQVVSTSSMKIASIVAHHPGSVHDARIFRESNLNRRLQRSQLQGVLLGNGGYPCRTYLLTPLLAPTTPAEERYQRAHASTRQVVERLFGIWKRRFPCLQYTLRTNLATTKAMVHSCNSGIVEPLGPTEIGAARLRVNSRRKWMLLDNNRLTMPREIHSSAFSGSPSSSNGLNLWSSGFTRYTTRKYISDGGSGGGPPPV